MCVSLILSFIPLKTGSPISKLVLLKLADNADARGVCFPSLSYLAQYCEVSVRTVKRHINELEKQGFVKRIKRFDDSGRQRSNLYQLRLPSESHIEQDDLERADQEAIVQGKAQAEFNTVRQQSDECDTLQSVTLTATESDPLAHIIFQKEHKTGLEIHQSAQAQDEAVIHLLTKEGSAPVYQEFYHILERTYPKLDVQQELYAMQTWLYVNPEKRKTFEHIGHFVNGWLRRSAKAKAKQGASLACTQVKKVQAEKFQTAKKPKSKKASKQKQGLNPDKRNAVDNDVPTRDEAEQETPVTQALAEYHATNRVNPFEARIQALIQSRTPESS
ncbi:helix-turn-helix domain-containing protein [Vibrio fortis]|uniref:helix-turn-helix domain-containing protein n=1 Tax=Vibrio fortis TaxID=212667 RepID=UPI003EC04831